MKKIKSFFGNLFRRENRKKCIVAVAALVAVVAAVVVISLVVGGKNNQEKVLSSRLNELGTSFYEEFYYEQIGSSAKEREEFLAKFEKIGIKINLENLIRFNTEAAEELKETFVNNKTNETCDYNNSKVVIYPAAPYGKEDYTIETIVECGFENQTTQTTTKKATKASTVKTTTKSVETSTTKKAKK